MIKIITPDNSVATIEGNTEKATLKQLKEWIECEWIEIVRVLYEGHPEQLIVDEDGRLNGKPINPVATEIYLEGVHRSALNTNKHIFIGSDVNIVGTAVLLTHENKLT